MNILRYPPAVRMGHILFASILSLVVLIILQIEGLMQFKIFNYFILAYLTVSSIIVPLCFYASMATLASRRYITDLSLVMRSTEYVKGEGFRSTLTLHLDGRLGRKRLNSYKTSEEKAIVIYEEMLLLVEEVKKRLECNKGVYKGVERVRASSLLLRPFRAGLLGIDVEEVTSPLERLSFKISTLMIGLKFTRKKRLYRFNISSEEFKAIDTSRAKAYIGKLKKELQ